MISLLPLRLLLGVGTGAVAAGLAAGWLTFHFLTSAFRTMPVLPTGPRKFSLPQTVPLVLALLGLGLAFEDFGTGAGLLLATVVGWFLARKTPGWVEKRKGLKKQEKLAEVFPPTLGMSIQALKTGQTVPQVLQYLSRECPRPLREELALVCVEMDLGATPEQALAKMSERFPSFPEFQQFLESYKIARATGANLTHLLEVQWEGLEEKNRILRRREAMTAQARLSGLLMGLLPFLLGLVFFLMDPGLMAPLFTQAAGWAILLMAALLETCGFLWIRHLLRMEF